VVRRRYFQGSKSKELSSPASPYLDYDRLVPVVPTPPSIEYLAFDATVVVVPAIAHRNSVDLQSLREMLLSSTKRDPSVQFTQHAQEFPDPPEITYPSAPGKPAVRVQVEPKLPQPPVLQDFLPQPTELEKRFPFIYAIHCNLTRSLTDSSHREALIKHNLEHQKLETELAAIQSQNRNAASELRRYDEAYSRWKELTDSRKKQNDANLIAWNEAKKVFLKAQVTDLARLVLLKKAYFALDPDGIRTHARLVLNLSPYPSPFPRNVDVEYDPESRILVVNYQLPDTDVLAILKPSGKKGAYGEYVPANATERRRASDDVLYMIMLRGLRELVLADEAKALSAVAINGWVSFKDKATGRERTEYIMSLFATTEQVCGIDFANVEARTCFHSLKGVSAPRPSECVPIAPILKFDKADRRIISSRDVLDHLATQSNLAIMPWDDFEHLIREVFEKEFGHNGAEVRVTQASHDRGVDALVFDPDPVRGGKYVIQAKRYTMTVNVSSVRDLYGTVLNEGANRGILVTTSTYGPDAYEFAKDKPITLIDGPRLLHMLEKHGYNFRIDLKEARRLLLLAAEPDATGK
jgi:restriction system protein